MANTNVQICARTEGLADSFRGEPWPQKKITYCVTPDGYKGTMPPAHIVTAFKEAWMGWAEMLDIEPTEVPSDSQAMVRSKFGQIDGSRQVLAWSELSDGTMTPKRQLYDDAETWSWEENPTSKIDLQRVACHEIGHVLGLVHDEQNAPALMAPMYNPAIRDPTPRDVARMQQLGYALRPIVPPVVPPVVPEFPTVPPVTPPAGNPDKDTIRRSIDAAFAQLRATYADRPVMLFAINVAYSLAYAWMGKLAPGGAAAPPAITVEQKKEIATTFFTWLKQLLVASPDFQVAVDAMKATIQKYAKEKGAPPTAPTETTAEGVPPEAAPVPTPAT